jgi:hypothetical protein
MERSKHHTHAIRIQFLVRRARKTGFSQAAERIEHDPPPFLADRAWKVDLSDAESYTA